MGGRVEGDTLRENSFSRMDESCEESFEASWSDFSNRNMEEEKDEREEGGVERYAPKARICDRKSDLSEEIILIIRLRERWRSVPDVRKRRKIEMKEGYLILDERWDRLREMPPLRECEGGRDCRERRE